MVDPTPAPSPTPSPTAASATLTDGSSSLLDAALGTPPPAPAPAPAPEPPKPTDQAPKPTDPAAKYEAFKVPEGVTLEGEALDKASGMFRELGLDQAGAQRLVDFYGEQIKSLAEGPAKLWKDTQDLWIDELRSDPTIGKGIENGTVGASIAKMVNALPAPLASSFREAMNFTGAGNNPAIVRGFYELSKRFAEPGPVQGNAPATAKTKPGAAAALYPNLSPKET